LFAYGSLTNHTVAEFGDGGFWYESQEDLIEALIKQIGKGCTLLVKGSRSMKMEYVTAAVSERFTSSQVSAQVSSQVSPKASPHDAPQVDPQADPQAGVCCQ